MRSKTTPLARYERSDPFLPRFYLADSADGTAPRLHRLFVTREGAHAYLNNEGYYAPEHLDFRSGGVDIVAYRHTSNKGATAFVRPLSLHP